MNLELICRFTFVHYISNIMRQTGTILQSNNRLVNSSHLYENVQFSSIDFSMLPEDCTRFIQKRTAILCEQK